MTDLKVQGPPVRGASAQETAAWTGGLGAQLEAAWGERGLSKAAVTELCTRSLLAEASVGVPLEGLPLEIAQQVLEARAQAMQEFFASWAESLRKNAARDKKAALKRFLEQAREAAVTRAAEELRRSAARPATEPVASATAPERAAPPAARPGPLDEPGTVGVGLRARGR